MDADTKVHIQNGMLNAIRRPGGAGGVIEIGSGQQAGVLSGHFDPISPIGTTMQPRSAGQRVLPPPNIICRQEI